MAINPDTTVRKIFSMPRELAERVAAFREAHSGMTEAQALRLLIGWGLLQNETAPDIVARCRQAEAEGRTFGWVLAHILEVHPLVERVHFDSDGMVAVLRTGDLICYDASQAQDADPWRIEKGTLLVATAHTQAISDPFETRSELREAAKHRPRPSAERGPRKPKP